MPTLSQPVMISHPFLFFPLCDVLCPVDCFVRVVAAMPRTAFLSDLTCVHWSEDMLKLTPRFFGRSRVRLRMPPWVSNTIARDQLA